MTGERDGGGGRRKEKKEEGEGEKKEGGVEKDIESSLLFTLVDYETSRMDNTIIIRIIYCICQF